MPSLFAIAVIGRRGQLITPAETPWFREMTWGKELVAGDDVWYESHNMVGRTFLSPEQFWDAQHLKEYVRHTATENIFLIGGAEVFDKFAGVVDRWYIDKAGYDAQRIRGLIRCGWLQNRSEICVSYLHASRTVLDGLRVITLALNAPPMRVTLILLGRSPARNLVESGLYPPTRSELCCGILLVVYSWFRRDSRAHQLAPPIFGISCATPTFAPHLRGFFIAARKVVDFELAIG